MLEGGPCNDCKVWESTLDLEAVALDATATCGGRGKEGVAKAGKQAKVEAKDEQQVSEQDSSIAV